MLLPYPRLGPLFTIMLFFRGISVIVAQCDGGSRHTGTLKYIHCKETGKLVRN